MTSLCFYFQVHQPYRLREFTFFDIGTRHQYFDDIKNREVLNKVSDKCYLPMNKLLLEMIDRYEGAFRCSFSISGVALEQFEQWRPDVLESFKALARTGCVEFIGETYYHSLAWLYSKEEFVKQVEKHKAAIFRHFGTNPKVFRNTELQYNNELAAFIENMGYEAILAEGVSRILDWRSPNFIYQAPNVQHIKTLLKNYQLSDDIAFRFGNQSWSEWPLTAEKYATWCHSLAAQADTINLFMDYETFGEHQWKETGIFDFMYHLPRHLLLHPDFSFKTVSETASAYAPRGFYDAHHMTSWADQERDLSAWLGNPMQDEAAWKIFSIDRLVHDSNNTEMIETWQKLTTSDHFYYMCTKYWSDGDVHKYFSPYESPYEAYIYFMNAFSDFEAQLEKRLERVLAKI